MTEQSGELARSPRELREELERMIRLDLVGPAGGEEEELTERPSERYLLGMLAPREQVEVEVVPEDDLAVGDISEDDGEEGTPEVAPPSVEQLLPSSFGMTFVVDVACRELVVTVSWGHYETVQSEVLETQTGRPRRVWRRRRAGGPLRVVLPDDGDVAELTPDPDEADVIVRGRARLRGGRRIVTLFLVNKQPERERGGDAAWLFQAELAVRAPDRSPVFASRGLVDHAFVPDIDRAELASLDMLYRHECELAVGHGVAVHADPAPGDRTRAVELRTVAMPAADVPLTEAPGAGDFADQPAVADAFARVVTDMQRLAEAADADLPAMLGPLADAYEAWIERQAARVDDPVERLQDHEQAAADNLAQCRVTAARIRAGIAALVDPLVAEAFRFANAAMWQQRVHTVAVEARREEEGLSLSDAIVRVDVREQRSWRPFQLAFVLLNLPAVADLRQGERAGEAPVVDLLFFSTGGGKTEAYLGLTAFTLAIRRLQGEVEGRSGADGVAVLMRYTLRLLTLQQFQRATALVCACELLRRGRRAAGDMRWGATPFRIGLWVGRRSTPTTTEQADDWAKRAQRSSTGNVGGGGSPMQLARCPWCGTDLRSGRDLRVDVRRGRTLIFCGDRTGECPFTGRQSPGEGLPVVVVDEELYRLLPGLVIATVDKFSLMPWVGKTQALFGEVSRRCARHGFLTPDEDHPGSHPRQGELEAVRVEDAAPLRPPDLIIQDELHLISGPLGSLVGLYETAIDRLCAWGVDGAHVRPKVIASTATIRRAHLQVDQLFARSVAVFPPPALDARDSFFALQRDRPRERDLKPGRRYLGICAPGRRFKSVLIRVYVAQLGAAMKLLQIHPGEAADAYMTLVGYFNSLRELGGMRRLIEDDVQTRLYRIEDRGLARRPRLELDELTSRKSAEDIPAILDKLGVAHEHPRPTGRRVFPLDVLLATNMISVGVDVQRLGAMVVAGQPKGTSEYIQATSRVGRRWPGLVLTVYNWARPRDLSHYESFEHHHATLYRQVEALSVTPFAPRALDRGLTGILVAMARLGAPEWNPNDGAQRVQPLDPRLKAIVTEIARRAAGRTADAQLEQLLIEALQTRIDAWDQERHVPQRDLVYSRKPGAGTEYGLLKEPSLAPWDTWTVPMSMRDVEPAVGLILRERGIGPPAAEWEMPAPSSDGEGES